MNIIRAMSQLVGTKQVEAIMRVDVPTVSTKSEQYCKSNKLGYYILTNTWLHIIKQYSEYGWIRVLEALTTKGLFKLIGEASEASEEFINGGIDAVTSPLFKSIIKDVYRPYKGWGIPNMATQHNSPESAVLLILRYPKRFSPLYNDKVQEETLKRFISCENRSKLLQRTERSAYLTHWMREIISDIINWDAVNREIDSIIDNNEVRFTSGVGYNSKANLGSKVVAVSKTDPYLFKTHFMEYHVPKSCVREEGEGLGSEYRPVKVQAVPKSYKSSRIIAMEDTARQGIARSIADVLDKHLPGNIKIHDQSVNQRLAAFGSDFLDVSTVDLTSASDSIIRSLAIDVFPYDFWCRIEPYLGTHTVIDGTVRRMQQMSTSGNSLTFVLESIIFLAIDILAHSMCKLYRGEALSHGFYDISCIMIEDMVYYIPSVYGDDQVVYNDDFVTTVEILQKLGFLVNESKSYSGESPYRESCGAEYIKGKDVASYYFPRFPIEGTLSEGFSARVTRNSRTGELETSLTRIISLQHKLYNVCYSASRFLYDLVKEMVPKMTSSLEGSKNGDLWEYDVIGTKFSYPKAGILAKVYSPFLTKPPAIVFVGNSKEYVESYKRELHFRPVTRYVLEKPVSDYMKRAFEEYRYYRFLKYGPEESSDPWLRILGISDPPISLEMAFGKPEIFWTFLETAD